MKKLRSSCCDAPIEKSTRDGRLFCDSCGIIVSRVIKTIDDDENGKTLLDEFAMAALGQLKLEITAGEQVLLGESAKIVAGIMYEVAQAMMEERKKYVQ